jgi:glycosyltransferase involved in cell wall biosynthesis
MPPVSVGVPVYNGARYLPEALESVLSQSYGDFELVISDNASTDATEEICRDYVARDGRVRYHRVEKNRGIAWNFNRVVWLSQGRYFKWMSHDDRWHPELLARSVSVLDEGVPNCVLCYPRTVIIDEKGAISGSYEDGLDLRHPSPGRRLEQLMARLRRCNAIFGLMPRDLLTSTRLMGAFPRADRVLLAELALRGQFWEIPDEMFFRRLHPEGSTFANTDAGQRRRFWDPDRRGEILTLPRWRLAYEHLRAVSSSPLTSADRRVSYGVVVRHYAGPERPVLVGDVKSMAHRAITAFSRNT